MADKPKSQDKNQYDKSEFKQDKSQVKKARIEKKEEKELKRIQDRKENRIVCGGGMCEVC